MKYFRDPAQSLHAAFVRVTVGWLKPKRLRMYPPVIAGMSVLAWLVNWLVRPGLDGTSRYVIIGGDFLAAYTGGRFLLEGRMSQLYDFNAQMAFMREVIASAATTTLPPFVYPPYNTVLYALFAVGPYPAGLMLWLAAGVLSVTVAAHLFRRHMLPLGVPSTGRLLLTSALFYPTLAWAMYGQSTGFCLLLYTLTYLYLRRSNDLAAGLALGLLAFKPHLAIGLALVLLVQRRWRAIVGGALGVGVWLAAGFAVSPEAMFEYIRFSSVLIEVQGPGMWGDHSLVFLALLLLGQVWSPLASALAVILLAGGIALLLRWWWDKPWQPGTDSWDLRMAASIALGLLISPHLYWYDLMLLLLPLGIVWAKYVNGHDGRPLDGGPILAWTATLYLAAWLSSYLTVAQLWLTAAAGLAPLALQISVPVILAWCGCIARRAETGPARQAERARAVLIAEAV